MSVKEDCLAQKLYFKMNSFSPWYELLNVQSVKSNVLHIGQLNFQD